MGKLPLVLMRRRCQPVKTLSRSFYILPCSALRTRQQLPTAWLLLVCASALSGLATGDERTQRYQTGEQVVLWANKVGPYENPQVCVCVSVCLSVCV